YIYDRNASFSKKCNLSMVVLEKITPEDAQDIKNLLANHAKYTGSTVAKRILLDFENQAKRFIKVMPLEYKRILENKKLERKLDLVEVSDG
ncbi:MAG: hypothetical protein PHN59_06270, partial [Candidatus Omnitrophica bacterium]|nr:hypothetical protein [Candidatus Omnitrophota bacterium]